MNLQQQFERVVSSPFASLSSQELKPIALAFWYEDYVPELNGLNFLQLQKAGYLIELFASFNCVSQTRQLELLHLTEQIKQSLPHSIIKSELLCNHHHVDAIAQEWNIESDLCDLMQNLLQFQTRHYIHSAVY